MDLDYWAFYLCTHDTGIQDEIIHDKGSQENKFWPKLEGLDFHCADAEDCVSLDKPSLWRREGLELDGDHAPSPDGYPIP